MAEIRLNRDEAIRVKGRIPEIKEQLNDAFEEIKNNFRVIASNIDSSGLNDVLIKFGENLDTLNTSIDEDLNITEKYLDDKIINYRDVANAAREMIEQDNEFLNRVNQARKWNNE